MTASKRSKALALVLVPVLSGAALTASSASDGVGALRPVTWAALRPRGQGDENTMFPGTASSVAQGETLSTGLAGTRVRLEGFLLPVSRKGDQVFEFLLVPWMGACIHAPHPPPNQMVHVIPTAPVTKTRAYERVAVTGTLRARLARTQVFQTDGAAPLETGYNLGVATVERQTDAAARPVAGNPWSRLTR